MKCTSWLIFSWRDYNNGDCIFYAVHPELLCKAISAMSSNTSAGQFQADSGIASASVARRIIEFLESNGIGSHSANELSFSGADRLKTAAIALRMGCDVEQVSARLSWQDFEQLASETLRSLGYHTRTNVRLTKPRMEIDVVGVSSGFAIAVDCKHWSRGNASSVSAYAKKQAARTKRLAKHEKISQAVPAILTLHAQAVKFAGGVPVVPVSQFRSFVMDVKGFLPEMRVIR
jgi:hypothetical protein